MGVKLAKDFVTVPVSLESNGELCIYVGEWKYKVPTKVVGLNMPKQNNYFVENEVLVFLVHGDWKVIIWRTGDAVTLFRNKIYYVSKSYLKLPVCYDPIQIGVDEDNKVSLEMLSLGNEDVAIVAASQCPVVKYTTDSTLIKSMIRTASYRPESYRVDSTFKEFTVRNRFSGKEELKALKSLGCFYNVGIGGMCCGQKEVYG